jgi:ankyrin repeat protein
MIERSPTFEEFRPIALILATRAKILETLENRDTDYIFDWIKTSYEGGTNKEKGGYKVDILCLNIGLQRFQKLLCKNVQYNPLLHIVAYCNRMDIAEYMFNKDLCYIEKNVKGSEANSKQNLLLKCYLEFACKEGCLDLTRFLLHEINNRQESFQHFTFDGSFLKTACCKKHFDIFKYLLEDEKAKDEASEFLKGFPLHYACLSCSLEMIKYLIKSKQLNVEKKDNHGETPLYTALSRGKIAAVQYLIEEKKACIESSYEHGQNAFQVACNSWSQSLELVKYIYHITNPNVDVQDENGSTALHLACERGNHKFVKFLITEMKASLHSVDKEEKTPLHIASKSSRSKASTLKFLVNQGANVLAKDETGKIPLQLAKFNVEKKLIPFLKAATNR